MVGRSSTVVLIALGLLTGAAHAQDQQGLEPHVHGVAELTAALDGNTLSVGLHSPLDNLVGFEHAPETAEQKAAWDGLLERLRHRPGEVIAPAEAAGCRPDEPRLELPAWNEAGHVAKGDEHHAAAGGDDREHEEDAAGEHEAGHEEHGHAEFVAEFTFVCDAPARLDAIALPVMGWAPNITRIEAMFLSEDRQTAATIVPDNPAFRLEQ